MPAPTAPELTRAICRPALHCAAICSANRCICARSSCFWLSVRTPVPTLTTILLIFLSSSRRMLKVGFTVSRWDSAQQEKALSDCSRQPQTQAASCHCNAGGMPKPPCRGLFQVFGDELLQLEGIGGEQTNAFGRFLCRHGIVV